MMTQSGANVKGISADFFGMDTCTRFQGHKRVGCDISHHFDFIIRNSLFDAEGSPMANSIFPSSLRAQRGNLNPNSKLNT